jgi:hypothetical protein
MLMWFAVTAMGVEQVGGAAEYVGTTCVFG